MSNTASYLQVRRATLPVVPLRDMVVFPHMMAPFIVGREASVRALERSLLSDDRRILYVHGMHVTDREEFKCSIKEGFEQVVKEAFE